MVQSLTRDCLFRSYSRCRITPTCQTFHTSNRWGLVINNSRPRLGMLRLRLLTFLIITQWVQIFSIFKTRLKLVYLILTTRRTSFYLKRIHNNDLALCKPWKMKGHQYLQLLVQEEFKSQKTKTIQIIVGASTNRIRIIYTFEMTANQLPILQKI